MAVYSVCVYVILYVCVCCMCLCDSVCVDVNGKVGIRDRGNEYFECMSSIVTLYTFWKRNREKDDRMRKGRNEGIEKI